MNKFLLKICESTHVVNIFVYPLQEHPELIRDQYWDDIFPELPYTAASEQFMKEPVIGSAAKVEVAKEDGEFLPMPGKSGGKWLSM